jgi:hypothetical protein
VTDEILVSTTTMSRIKDMFHIQYVKIREGIKGFPDVTEWVIKEIWPMSPLENKLKTRFSTFFLSKVKVRSDLDSILEDCTKLLGDRWLLTTTDAAALTAPPTSQ